MKLDDELHKIGVGLLPEAERIRRAGGEVRRVALDFELKKSINQRLAKIHSLPAEEQSREKQQIAQDHGLTVVSGKIPLPDLRLEYETANREQAKVDIELLSSDYRPSQIAAKARAGFTMYALSQDAARLRTNSKHDSIELFKLNERWARWTIAHPCAFQVIGSAPHERTG